MKRFCIFASVVLFAISCNYEDNIVVKDEVKAESKLIVDGKISLEKAIANVDFVYKNIGGHTDKKRKIKSVELLTSANVSNNCTRASQNGEDSPVAYVVNYENNEGYAILAADAHFPPVISIGDEGNFSTSDFIEFTQNVSTTRSGDNINSAQEVQYALINNSLLLPPIDFGGLNFMGVDTTVMFKCLPLVKTKWNQGSPYNYYAPIDESYNAKSLAGCVPVAGAQVLASLCYHHNWRPTTQISDEYSIDWYTLNRLIFADKYKFDANDFSYDAKAVASLIRAVGDNIGAEYSYNGTSAFTSSLGMTYEQLGMTSTTYGNSSSFTPVTTDDIFDMIVVENYPVNARSTSSTAGGGGHSFILDGWLRLEYSILGVSSGDSSSPAFTRDDNFQYNFDLVHINLGWGGMCDGYYLPGAFDLTQDKYREFAEEDDIDAYDAHVYDLNVSYLIYSL